MDSGRRPTKISRVDLRYRHQAQDVSPEGESVRRREADGGKKENPPAADDVEEPLLIREVEGRPIMGRAHLMFHRRQAPSPKVLTIAVEVVATLDANGNVIGQETRTQPFPQVPSVPPFPSDLTVPAYPWPSGVPTALGVSPSPAPTSAPTPGLSSATPPTTVSASLGFNSTSSIISSSSFLSTTNSTSSSSSSRSSSSSSRSSSTSTRSSTQSSTSSSSTAASSTAVVGGGGPIYTAPPPSAAPTAASGPASGDNGPLDTPKVVGSVIGSLAGAALLLALLLFLIKRHKKNQRGAMELPDGGDNEPIAASGMQMATRSSFVPTGAAAFLHRFSGASKSTTETSTTGGERSFQRISGRKLPSAFSEGMTSEQFARGEGTLSGSSFYKDETGFHGGTGFSGGKEFGKETGEPSSSGVMGTKERFMPSPARTPVIHHPDDAPLWGASRNGGRTLSPPHSPDPDAPPRGTLGRSHPSHDGSRSSRFTENV